MVLGLLFFTLVLILIIPLRFEFQIHNDFSQIRVIIWLGPLKIPLGLRLFKMIAKRLPFGSEKGDKKGSGGKGENSGGSTFRLKDSNIFIFGLRLMSVFLREIYSLKLKLRFNAGDPSVNGILTGLIWAVISPLIGIIHSKKIRFLNQPIIDILPSFEPAPLYYDLEFNCIFQIRLGQIIYERIRSFVT